MQLEILRATSPARKLFYVDEQAIARAIEHRSSVNAGRRPAPTHPYSYRKASMGSNRAAFIAG